MLVGQMLSTMLRVSLTTLFQGLTLFERRSSGLYYQSLTFVAADQIESTMCTSKYVYIYITLYIYITIGIVL